MIRDVGFVFVIYLHILESMLFVRSDIEKAVPVPGERLVSMVGFNTSTASLVLRLAYATVCQEILVLIAGLN